MSALYQHFVSAAEQAGWDTEPFKQLPLQRWPELLRQYGYEVSDDENPEDCLQRIITDLTA